MEITLEQKMAIYKAMDVLVDIEKAAWDEMKAKGFDLHSKEMDLHNTADEAWWQLRNLWDYF